MSLFIVFSMHLYTKQVKEFLLSLSFDFQQTVGEFVISKVESCALV